MTQPRNTLTCFWNCYEIQDLKQKVSEIDADVAKEMRLFGNRTLNKMKALATRETRNETNLSNNIKSDIKTTVEALNTLSVRRIQKPTRQPFCLFSSSSVTNSHNWNERIHVQTRVKRLSDNAPPSFESVVHDLSLKFDAIVANFCENVSRTDDHFENEKRLSEQQLHEHSVEYDKLSKVLVTTIQLACPKTTWHIGASSTPACNIVVKSQSLHIRSSHHTFRIHQYYEQRSIILHPLSVLFDYARID